MERDTSDALNVYRTLFYKGDPDAKTMERTPSAFITPLPQRNSALSLDPGGDQEALDEVTPPNPLLLQLSTGSQADVGAESKRGIEVDRFNHLVFILSAGTYQLFIDGELDSKLQFDDPIIHNDHSLMLGYAPGMNGPKMIMSDLKVWASELSPDEVKKIWTREAGRHSTVGTLKPTTSDRKSLAIWPPSGIPQKHVESTRESTLATLSSIRERECGGDVRERLMLWEEAANCGSTSAALMTAEIYLFGTERENLLRRGSNSSPCSTLNVGERDIKQSMKYLELASSGGNAESMYRLSLLLSSGVGIEGVDEMGLSGLGLGDGAGAATIAATIRSETPGGAQESTAAIMQAPLSTPAATSEAISSYALDLLHLAAGKGHVNAAMILAHRYSKGYGVKVDHEAATYYMRISSDSASDYYHLPGNQPMHEFHRLRVGHEADLVKGQQGEDDEQLQFTILMAEKGDVEAMSNYASMLYWGVRGFERDHVKALDFWNRAAEHGHVGALCGAASMYVRGEGMDTPDITKAVEYYEQAREKGSATAMNGLGYAYFLGQGGLEEDKERAFGYFLQAAQLEQDADSLSNAAHCYSTGQGVEKDDYKAAVLYDKAATRFGNFDAAIEMGRRFHDGEKGVSRDPAQAAKYLMSASRAGDTGELIRKGFDLFMDGDFDAAFKVYVEAAELGYEVGANNAAYLLDVGKARIGGGRGGGEGASEGALIAHNGGGGDARSDHLDKAASLRFHWMASEENNAESFAAIGDSFYYGIGNAGAVDVEKAFWWYSKAGMEGSVKGAYYTAWLQEYYKGNLQAAKRQYERVHRMITLEEGGMELMLLVKFNIWRTERKMGWGWKAYEGIRGALFGEETGGSILPKLPIERGGGEGGEGGEGLGNGDGKGAEGGKDWIGALLSAITKVRFIAQGTFLRHRGTVFGLNQSEDLGNDIVWGNVCIAVCIGLLTVNLFRGIAMLFGAGGLGGENGGGEEGGGEEGGGA